VLAYWSEIASEVDGDEEPYFETDLNSTLQFLEKDGCGSEGDRGAVMNRPSSIPTAPSRRRFLAVLSAGAAATAAPAALAATLAHLPETETASSALAPAVVAPSPDAGLLVLFGQYMATNAESRRLRAIYDRARDKHRAKHPMPEVIKVQPGDAELGLPECPDLGRFGRSYVCRISELQQAEWPVVETVEPPEGLQFYRVSGGQVVHYAPPSAAARARANEIIEACDRWEAKYWRHPRELRTIERQADRADKLKNRLRARIDRTRARTVAGLAAKAQVAAIEGDNDTQFADTTLASIMRDMRALAKIGGAQS
jgi:hypothetical protein